MGVFEPDLSKRGQQDTSRREWRRRGQGGDREIQMMWGLGGHGRALFFTLSEMVPQEGSEQGGT